MAQDRRPPLTRGVQGRFLFVGERLCLDFVNTRVVVHSQLVDLLQGFPDWVEWFLEAKVLNSSQARQALRRWKGSPQASGAFEVVKAFRESLRMVVEHAVRRDRIPQSSISQINALLRHPIGYSVLACGEDRWRCNAAWYSMSPFTCSCRSPSQPPISSLTAIDLSSKNVRTRHVFSTSMIRPRTTHVVGTA